MRNACNLRFQREAQQKTFVLGKFQHTLGKVLIKFCNTFFDLLNGVVLVQPVIMKTIK